MKSMWCSLHLQLTGEYRDMNTTFDNFKQDIDDYFPSFVNIIGTGFYKNGNLNHFK